MSLLNRSMPESNSSELIYTELRTKSSSSSELLNCMVVPTGFLLLLKSCRETIHEPYAPMYKNDFLARIVIV